MDDTLKQDLIDFLNEAGIEAVRKSRFNEAMAVQIGDQRQIVTVQEISEREISRINDLLERLG